MTYSDPPSKEVGKTTVGESKLDAEWIAFDCLMLHTIRDQHIEFHGRMLNMSHPATYFVTEDGTFMITVERVSRAVMFPGNGG